MQADMLDATPVFVAGPDRSGTTLMFALLASHPDLCMVRRTNMWRYFYRRYGDLADNENLDRCLQDMMRYRRMRHLQPDADRIRREFSAGTPSYGRLFALFHDHNAQRAGKSRWGDKSLHTEHFADDVFTEFPRARILHLVRDPRDRYASVRRRNRNDLSRVGAATGRWLRSVRAARRNTGKYPDRYRIVRYEDLVLAPESTMRHVCEFIGLPYMPRMLSMDAVPEHRDRGGNSSFGDLEPGAISVRGIGRYRATLSPADRAFIQLVAGDALAKVGYARDDVHLSATERACFVGWLVPMQGLRMVAWMTKARLRMRRRVRVPQFRLQDAFGEA
jgi:hypothetical protein